MTSATTPDAEGSGLWTWAVATYGKPGVKDALLSLQDRFGIDAPLLLWRIWLHERGLGVGPQTDGAALELTRVWKAEVVQPLRDARNRLKLANSTLAADVDVAGAKRLRQEILAAELSAEKLQLDALERLALGDVVPSRRVDLLAALAECAELAHLPPTEFSPLIAALANR